MIRHVLLMTFCVLLIPKYAAAQMEAEDEGPTKRLTADIGADFRHHYGLQSLGRVAVGVGITGILANSRTDAEVQRIFRDKLHGAAGDSISGFATDIGDAAQPMYATPLYLGAMWLGNYSKESETAVARWGANSFRAMLVATPELLAIAHISGGQRPEEGEPGWNRFADDNGVSGHSFYGAVPIITAARMTEEPWLRYTLYAASTLPGFARIYDDKHYVSQAFMGWWLAYIATDTIEHTNLGRLSDVRIVPVPYPDGGGLQLSFRF